MFQLMCCTDSDNLYLPGIGSLFVPGPGQADAQSLAPPSGVGSYSMQHPLHSQAGGPDGMSAMTPYSQKDSASTGRKPIAESMHQLASNTVQVLSIASSNQMNLIPSTRVQHAITFQDTVFICRVREGRTEWVRAVLLSSMSDLLMDH